MISPASTQWNEQKKKERYNQRICIYFTIDDYIIIGFHILTHIILASEPEWSIHTSAHDAHSHTPRAHIRSPFLSETVLSLRFIIIKMFAVWRLLLWLWLPSFIHFAPITASQQTRTDDVFSVSILMFCLFYIRAFG